MLGNSDEGIRKMWTYKAKYSGWGKLQPSPLWRVKVTRRKRSILDVAFLKFKDFTNKYLWKACVTLALVEMHQLRPFIHTWEHYWGGSDLDLHHKSQIQASGSRVQWKYLLVSRRCRHSWTLDRVWPLEALKREQASRVTLPTLLLLTAHCSPADTRRCSHNSGHTITIIGVRRERGGSKHLWYAQTHPRYVIFICR